jgi:hypothetical protein
MAKRPLAVAVILFVAIMSWQCRWSGPMPAAPVDAPAAAAANLESAVSIRELMTSLVDPLADNIFDAVGVEITPAGAVETAPKTDEDWAKIDQGAIVLAEASNLLKLPRKAAPAHDYVAKNPGELPPAEIDANIEMNRAAWNAYANGLRTEALKVREVVTARNTQALYQAGSDIDRACENCHIAFWYPNERALVEKNRNSKVFSTAPAQ